MRQTLRRTALRQGMACGLAALLASACASLAEPQSDWVGCYQFRWDESARTLGLPWGFELLDEPLEEGWPISASYEGVRRALTATSPTGREDHPFGYWRVTAEDSVEVGYPAGGAGFSLELGREGRQDLAGTAEPVGDVLQPGAPAGRPAPRPVLAYRVLCGAG